MSAEKEKALAPPYFSALFDNQQPPDKQYLELKRWIENFSGDDRLGRVMKEVLESGVFQDGSLEGKPLKTFYNFFMDVCNIIWASNEEITQEKIAADFDPILNTYKAITPLSKFLGIKIKRIQTIFDSLIKLRDDTLKKVAQNVKIDPADKLIRLFYRGDKIASDRAISRSIELLLQIPSIKNYMITDEGVRQKIRNLRKAGKIPH